ncbi:uncharacterized protein TEOVI_000775400 [Trypanosoma equiperdum]|uniref:Uncharacterized protein n=1 Tax=Trypanosoma equiperdum TaxID=5694 RepID=A0A1G4I599_TRYEQ|nr:hypothetical protein, conserved [Trypanosoma equiperdum]
MSHSQNSTSQGSTLPGDSLCGEEGFAHYGHDDGATVPLGAGGGCSVSDSSSAHPPHRGIYLKPNVFMINGTAGHLMDLYYLSNSNATHGFGDSTCVRTASPPFWWGYKPPNSPTVLVSFKYSIWTAVEKQIYDIVASEEFTDAEVVANVEALGCSHGEKCWLQKAAGALATNLRENRLLAGQFAAEFLSPDVYLGRGDITCFLNGGGEWEGRNIPVLQPGMETALRAMRPGDEFGFIIRGRRLGFQGGSYPSMYSTGGAGTYNYNRCTSFPQCYFIHISLNKAVPRETTSMLPLQRYVLDVPFCTDNVGRACCTAPQLEGCSGTVFSAGLESGTFSHFYSFFHGSLSFFGPRGIVSKEGGQGVSRKWDSAEYQAARRAFCMAMTTALEGCLEGRLVGGMCGGGVEERPTHEDALSFLHECFFTKPRGDATVSFSVARIGPLADRELSSERLDNVKLGTLVTPLWLDMSLQSMAAGERDLINSWFESDNDPLFHLYFVGCHRAAMVVQFWESERERRSGCIEALAEDQLQQSSVGANNAPPKPILDGNVTTKHDLSCRITLHSFTNRYTVDDFFFVNPLSSLQTVRGLLDEISGLCPLVKSCEGLESLAHAVDSEISSCSSDSSERQVEGAVPLEFNQPTPTQSAPKVINIHPAPFGSVPPNRDAFRSVVKAIHKVCFTILLLTFYVDVDNMLAKGVASSLLKERENVLPDCFKLLGCLYAKLKRKFNIHFCEDAFCAASLLVQNDD